MTSIPGVREDVSIVGTGITHVPMVGKPKFNGLLIGADGSAVARIQDGALEIEVSDVDMAIAWRAAWQNAVAHLVIHRQKQDGGT